MLRRLSRFFSRISFRLMAFNLLLVFLPVAGILYLDTYEEHLVDAQRRSLIAEGDTLAVALSTLNGDAATLVPALRKDRGARIRVVDADGHVIADTSQESAIPYRSNEAERNVLYRIGSSITRPLVRLVRRPEP